jgi:hypothetical protein
MALIDPLLQALGWDPSDPSLVTPEYNVSGKRADYALLGDEGAPVVFLEAKRLSESIPNHRSQVVAYASELGIRYPALTNGSDWEVYDNTILKPIEERSILRLSINGSPAYQLALQFLLLWRPNLASGQPVAANEPIFTAPTPNSTPSEPVSNSQQPGTSPPPPPSNEGWKPLTDLPPDISWRSKPSQIRFPNGEEKTLQQNNWKRVLIEVAEWLIQESALTGDKCPIGYVPGRHIIHSEPVHPTGKPFFHPAVLSHSLYLASAANAKRAASACVYLMELCEQDPAAIWLKLN